MAALLRRQTAALLLPEALARFLSTAPLAEQRLAIPAEIAQLVSSRTAGLALMPPDVVAAIEQAAGDANRKLVKRRGQELAYRLRAMSRSQHRGGVNPNMSGQLDAWPGGHDKEAVAARRQRRGKRRQSRQQALEQLTRAAPLPVDVESRAAPQLDQMLQPMKGTLSAEEAAEAAEEREAASARSSIAEGGSLYDTSAALAYAATRMPACYAAVEACLREVQGRRAGWHPASMLDFGAGPGTAVWAAQHVWRRAPLDVVAVEPSAAMSWLGNDIQQRQRQQYECAGQRDGAAQVAGDSSSSSAAEPSTGRFDEDEVPVPPPRLRWMYKLPPRYRAAQGVQYDLVTAAYVLGELPGDAERRRLVSELWSRTAAGGVLLLLEPGTPSGSAHIQRARSQVLQAARQTQEQQQQQQQLEERREGGGAATAGGRTGVGAAHVVAPCPHDGICPLQSRTAWCHFVQRFQRTQLQRGAKASAGIQPRTYQDERYSYVAIAKAPRPAAHAPPQQPLLAGSFFPDMSDPQEAVHVPHNLQPRKVPANAQPLKLYSDSEEEEELWESLPHDSSSDLAGGRSKGDGEMELESIFINSNRRRYEAVMSSQPDAHLAQQVAASQSAGGDYSDSLDQATRQLLLNSVLEGQEEDDLEGDSELRTHLEEELAAAVARRTQLVADGQQQEVLPALPPAPVLAPVSEATTDLLYDGHHVDWEQQEPAAVAAALHASGGWSRVIRTPRKRSGHVMLDLCCAAPPQRSRNAALADKAEQQQAQDGQQQGHAQGGPGVLLRQVVSKAAARRDAGGTAPYRLARRLRWGDLWPLAYQARFKAEEPPAGQLGTE